MVVVFLSYLFWFFFIDFDCVYEHDARTSLYRISARTSGGDVLSALWYFNKRVFSKINIDENTSADEITKIVNKHTDQESYEDRRKNLILAKNKIKCN